MIDITAIIAEINAYLAALTIPFKSLETGRTMIEARYGVRPVAESR